MKKIRWISLLAGLLPQALWAAGEHADLMLIPTRVVLGDRDYSAAVVIKNPGQAAGNYSVELVDMQMQEDGNVVLAEAGKPAEYSAIPYVHVAPRSLTLKPGDAKEVRLILRRPANLEDGEYRAHLKVRIADDQADAARPIEMPANPKAISIVPKAHLAIIIPVILRHGTTSYTMRIDAPKLSQNASGVPVLDLYLSRDGNRSSMGTILVSYISPDGKAQPLASSNGIPVYRSTPRRFVSVPLAVPPDVTLTTGSLKIAYAAPAEEGGHVLAETTLRLTSK
jgi:hypothetical protein